MTDQPSDYGLAMAPAPTDIQQHPAGCICVVCESMRQAIQKPRPIAAIRPEDQIRIVPPPSPIGLYDVVKLRSSGPAMTVLKIEVNDFSKKIEPDAEVICAYIEGNGMIMRVTLPYGSLVKAEQ